MKNLHRFTGVIVGLAMMVAVAGFSISTAEITSAVAADKSDPAAEEEVLTKAINQTEEPDVVAEETTTIEATIEEEVPVEEESVEEAEPEYIEYTVQAGDSLWSIAQDYYGSGKNYVALAAYNDMATSDYIHPGDVLKVQNSEDIDLEAVAIEYEAATAEAVDTSESVVTTTSPVLGASSFDGDMDYDQAVALLKDGSSVDTSNMEYMGNWRITGYDPHCAHCCGKTNGITASGNQAEFGTSAGCNNLPLGTIIYIEGYGTYRIDDRGGMSTNHIDIAAPSHDVCYQLTGHANVYVVSYPS